MLNKSQFTVLAVFEGENKKLTQRSVSELSQLSLGAVNKIVAQLNHLGYIFNNKITELGIAALQPYRVKRAVFLAAGFGSRMVPITLNTPKPLVLVHGKRIIDTLIDSVLAAGIEDITIVRGYLEDQFDVLKNKYPQIKFITNKIYNEANNISSALVAKDLLQNSYILEADLLVFNPKIITKYQYSSNYLGIAVARTDDWCFEYNNGRITKMRIGGTDCYQMVGISYWTEEDGKKLSKNIEEVFNMPGGKERFWDQVALEYFIDSYNVYIRPCGFKDLVEIDSFNELKKIDKMYDC